MYINLVPLIDTELDPGYQTYAVGRTDTLSVIRVNAEMSRLGEQNTP